MNKKYKVGIVGATGMVGQRFALLLENHPWFEVVCLAASARSAGKPYKEALGSRWCMDKPIPANMADLPVYDAQADIEKITSMVDFVFCAVDMKKDEIRALEEQYAKHECPVVSNNSANRFTPDVPMVVPELNPQHIDIIPAQRKRLGTKRGFIAVKSNCSLQSYVPAIFPLHQKYGIKRVLVCTYQAISGAGKTFERWPEMIDNVIPYIGGEEEKSEKEPLKLMGHIEGDQIVSADAPAFTAQYIALGATCMTVLGFVINLATQSRWSITMCGYGVMIGLISYFFGGIKTAVKMAGKIAKWGWIILPFPYDIVTGLVAFFISIFVFMALPIIPIRKAYKEQSME